MEALFSQIKMRSWEGGPNTSIVRVIDHQSSMRMQSSDVPRLSSGNAPGADAIPAEVNKAGGLPMAEKLTELFHCMCRKKAIHQEFKDAFIFHLYNRIGNHQVCNNRRGLSSTNCWEDAGKNCVDSPECSS